ncbi:MAG: LysR family transcriptional regulator [Hyphomicrobiales bacterium]|nr:MAG: LysR family transcriptional regulator [Hyphomicrobiales bacterium]
MRPPLRQLEAFHAVAVHGNMTRAAAHLDISQPAVSRLVASLERNFGFALFERISGRLQPTPEARVLFDEVERALANLNHIVKLSEDIQSNQGGQLRIACLPGFATSLLPRVLAGFLKERPGLTLNLEAGSPESIEDWVLARQFDVGLSEQFEENPAIESETIQIRTVLVAPAGHELAACKVVTPRELDGLPIIHNHRNHPIFNTLRRAFAEVGARFNSFAEIRQFAPACIMVSQNCGVSVVSEIDAREYERQGLIVRPFAPAIPFQISILYPAQIPRSIATREFVRVFRKSLEPYQMDGAD